MTRKICIYCLYSGHCYKEQHIGYNRNILNCDEFKLNPESKASRPAPSPEPEQERD